MTQSKPVGSPVNRVDGPAKVTGAAKYAAEYNVPGLAWGQVVSAPIARGRILAIHSDEVLAIPGVLAVYSHENIRDVAGLNMKYSDQDAATGKHFKPLHDAKVRFSMQPVALVVAETFELARYASSVLRIDYEESDHETDLRARRKEAKEPKKHRMPPPKPRGKPKEAFRASAAQVKAEYYHEAEHHNPLEMYASTAVFDAAGRLTLYDKTQGVMNVQNYVSKVFGLTKKDVRVLSPYMGGGFGSGLRPQYQVFMAVLAAKLLQRPVRVVLTRQQMFSFGHRPATGQMLALGADAAGKLQAIYHYAFSETSSFEEYTENVVNWSGMLYSCKNVKVGHKIVKLNFFTPLDMRAPGAATGVPALESAMDELAETLGMDPLELRLKNYSTENENLGKPYSSKALKACYDEGAGRFGWQARHPVPRSRKEGHKLIGVGMATGVWDAQHRPSAAKAVFSADGRLVVSAAVSDIGTGTYTIMTQIAAQALGLPLELVEFRLGDSDLPYAPLEGGSWTAASTGTAVMDACQLVGRKLLRLAQGLPGSPFRKVGFKEVLFSAGALRLRNNPAISLQLTEIMLATGQERISRKHLAVPNMIRQGKYARNTHSAVFVEVAVDEDLGTVEIRRMVNAVAAGRILNPKTARSQILGGMVWGISMALHEESLPDHSYGRFMNHNLSEYHVTVNADVPELDVIFVEEQDDIASPIGVKGLGEIGIVGVPAAIANAIYNATGKRVREWPITPDKLL